MKREIFSFKIETMKPRNRVAEDMFDRDGPYKPKRVERKDTYRRREKHSKQYSDF